MDDKRQLIINVTAEEYRNAKAWAKAYGITIEELFNLMLNRLETERYDHIAALARELRADLTLD